MHKSLVTMKPSEEELVQAGFGVLLQEWGGKKKNVREPIISPERRLDILWESLRSIPAQGCHNWLLLVTERPHVICSPVQLNKIRFVRHLLHQDFHKKKFDLAVSTPSREDLRIRVLGTLLEGLPPCPTRNLLTVTQLHELCFHKEQLDAYMQPEK